jgi:hypothetical protein
MPDEFDEMKLVHALRDVAPRQARIDAVAAAFAAGSGSARRRLVFWRSSTLAMLLLGSAGWLIQMTDRAAPSVAPPALAVASAPPAYRSSQSLIMLQRSVREGGIDALPDSYLPAAATIRTSDSL